MPVLKIEKLVYGGKGIARSADGKVYFVGGVLPGEEIVAREISCGKNYSEALPVSIIKPSPFRRAPRCPLHTTPTTSSVKFCGGCDFQHIEYPEQLKLKKEIVAETVARIAGLKHFGHPVSDLVEDVEPSPDEFHCRNKAIVPFTPCDEGNKKIKSGFYAERSHEIIAAEDCPLQKEIVFQIVRFVRDTAPDFGIDGYRQEERKKSPRVGKGSLRHLCVRVNKRGEALVIFVVNPTENHLFRYEKMARSLVKNFNIEGHNKIIGILLNENSTDNNVIFNHRGWRTLFGVNHLTEYLPSDKELKLRVSYAGFLQVNTKVAAKLYQSVSEMLLPTESVGHKDFLGKTALDLYGGVGGFAITLARRKSAVIKKIISVEENETAVRDALTNATADGIDDITFYALPVEDFLENSVGKFKKNTLVVADPPRSGISPRAMKALMKIKPERLVYVSCDVATFARDMKILISQGYTLDGKIKPFDMFPQTHHIEIAACFIHPAIGV